MPKPPSKTWAYSIAALAASCAIALGTFIVNTTGELEQVKEPLATQCVDNGSVYNALRQVCEQIVDEDTPNAQPPLAPEDPAERFPAAPGVPVPTEAVVPPQFIPALPPVTLPAPPPVTLPAPPQQTVTLAAPPPETVTLPPPPPQTETVTLPPSTVTETVTAPPETTTVTVTETAGPPPPIIEPPN